MSSQDQRLNRYSLKALSLQSVAAQNRESSSIHSQSLANLRAEYRVKNCVTLCRAHSVGWSFRFLRYIDSDTYYDGSIIICGSERCHRSLRVELTLEARNQSISEPKLVMLLSGAHRMIIVYVCKKLSDKVYCRKSNPVCLFWTCLG